MPRSEQRAACPRTLLGVYEDILFMDRAFRY